MISTSDSALAKPHLTSEESALLRRELLGQREETRETIVQLDRDVHIVQRSRVDSSTDDEHDPEGATLAFEQSQSSALLRQARERLTLVDAALSRLDSQQYGSCHTCGESIGFARLSARPYTQQCIRCAERKGA